MPPSPPNHKPARAGQRRRPRAAAQAATATAAMGQAESVSAVTPAPGARSVSLGWAVLMALLPSVGSPTEALLQDTLKSALLAFAVLGLALWALLRPGPAQQRWQGHDLLLFPLLLLAYALGSMAWSHTYLAGVEAVRWFLFALMLYLALQTLRREHLPLLALGIHAGALGAAFWGTLQFWFDLGWFPQGPNPASTFVNRNFAAEWVVSALPFSVFVLLRASRPLRVALHAAALGFLLVFLMMTGTRSALLALLVTLPFLLWAAWRYRQELGWARWPASTTQIAWAVGLCTVLGLGLLPAGNPQPELKGAMPLERALGRAHSVSDPQEFVDGSLSIRMSMWATTARMIQAHPWAGVGAGAWEVQQPLYQTSGEQLENDYYVHNEVLQLLAEYGLVGWLALALLLLYLVLSLRRTLQAARPEADPQARAEAPWRALALCCMLALLMVSCAGFPWRLASTGALFALALGMLAASDARLAQAGWLQARSWPARPGWRAPALAALVAALALAVYITQQAVRCEDKIVSAIKLALSISQSGQPNDPRWQADKARLLQDLREGIAINPHYRKLTPMAADELARWGDWANALWIWQSVARSRPYITAILTNMARAHVQTGDLAAAWQDLAAAQKIQADAVSVRSLEVLLLQRQGQLLAAARLAQQALQAERYDADMLSAAYVLGLQLHDWDLALQGLMRQRLGNPEQAADAWLKIGQIRGRELGDATGALQAYRAALQVAPAALQEGLRRRIPAADLARL